MLAGFAHQVYTCFVDLEKAYDSVHRGVLQGGFTGIQDHSYESLYNWSEACVLTHNSMFFVGVVLHQICHNSV